MTIQEIFVHIAAMKKNGRHRQSYTNFFAQTDGDYSIVESRDSIVFWQTGEDNVCRIYFFCFDLDELSRQLSQVENDSILDYIGECSDSLSHAFHAGGFRQYACFLRLSNKNLAHVFDTDYNPYADYLERFAEETRITSASLEELDTLHRKLYDVFDKHSSHLFDRNRLKELIIDNKVLVYKEDGRLLSFLIYTIEGKRFYVAYVYNSAENHIALSMYVKAAKAAIQAGCTYGYSWVDETNETSLRYNRLKQYFPDGMTDKIFRKET